jgi:hypothetical protein
MATLSNQIDGIAKNLYYNGYDSDPELMGSAIKKIVAKVKKSVKKLKKRGGISITTKGGSASYGTPQTIPDSSISQQAGIMDKIKDPKILAGIVAGSALLYFAMKKKSRRK